MAGGIQLLRLFTRPAFCNGLAYPGKIVKWMGF